MLYDIYKISFLYVNMGINKIFVLFLVIWYCSFVDRFFVKYVVNFFFGFYFLGRKIGSLLYCFVSVKYIGKWYWCVKLNFGDIDVRRVSNSC